MIAVWTLLEESLRECSTTVLEISPKAARPLRLYQAELAACQEIAAPDYLTDSLAFVLHHE